MTIPAAIPRTRLKGRKVHFLVGTVNYVCDVSSVKLEPGDKDKGTTTFCDAASGDDVQWSLKLEAIQTMDKLGLQRFLLANRRAEVAFMFAPNGNDVPTEDQPHIIGTAEVGTPPEIGGSASVEGEDWTYEHTLKVLTWAFDETA